MLNNEWGHRKFEKGCKGRGRAERPHWHDNFSSTWEEVKQLQANYSGSTGSVKTLVNFKAFRSKVLLSCDPTLVTIKKRPRTIILKGQLAAAKRNRFDGSGFESLVERPLNAARHIFSLSSSSKSCEHENFWCEQVRWRAKAKNTDCRRHKLNGLLAKWETTVLVTKHPLVLNSWVPS